MSEPTVTEQDIRALVRRFYALALEDDLLGPMFRAIIVDFDAHYVVVENFWSHALLGTSRYKDHPYVHHLHLKVEQAHFDRWMTAFTRAARACLPTSAADQALKRAALMTESFKAGLLPLPTPKAKAG